MPSAGAVLAPSSTEQQSGAKPSAREVFELRCWARAHLFAGGEYDLQEAVDPLQDAAEASGLVAELGQDEVQRMMAEAFAAGPHDFKVAEVIAKPSTTEDAWNTPSWRKAALDYHEARGERHLIVKPAHDLPAHWEEMPVGKLWDKLNDPKWHGVAKSMIDVAEYLISSGTEERWHQWFDARTAQERKDILHHLEARGRRRK
jgi:hypothetical protein